VREGLQREAINPDLLEILESSQESAVKIEAVLRVLQRVTKVKESTYHGQVKMIDVEAELKEELKRLL
jgi:hypothetical protein